VRIRDLPPTEKPPFEVPYPWRPSEEDIQTVLLAKLWKAGYDAHSQVRLRPRPGYQGARFDIVVFVDKKAALIVEVKKGSRRARPASYLKFPTAQTERYRALTGVYTILLRGINNVDTVLAHIRDTVGPPRKGGGAPIGNL
jgi:hypothetical protein